MAKKQTRKSISVSRLGYLTSKELADERGVSLSSVVEKLLERWRGGELDLEAKIDHAAPSNGG